SLAILNEDKPFAGPIRARQEGGRRVARLLVGVDEKYDTETMARLYAEIGRRVHEERREIEDRVLLEALEDTGLPDHLLGQADDKQMDEYLVESHYEGQDRIGTEAGSPILAVGDGPGFFGPVVVPVPEGEAAEKLFDAVRLLSAVPEFSELKTARNPLETKKDFRAGP